MKNERVKNVRFEKQKNICLRLWSYKDDFFNREKNSIACVNEYWADGKESLGSIGEIHPWELILQKATYERKDLL